MAKMHRPGLTKMLANFFSRRLIIICGVDPTNGRPAALRMPSDIE
jgi:hypothetical protein